MEFLVRLSERATPEAMIGMMLRSRQLEEEDAAASDALLHSSSWLPRRHDFLGPRKFLSGVIESLGLGAKQPGKEKQDEEALVEEGLMGLWKERTKASPIVAGSGPARKLWFSHGKGLAAVEELTEPAAPPWRRRSPRAADGSLLEQAPTVELEVKSEEVSRKLEEEAVMGLNRKEWSAEAYFTPARKLGYFSASTGGSSSKLGFAAVEEDVGVTPESRPPPFLKAANSSSKVSRRLGPSRPVAGLSLEENTEPREFTGLRTDLVPNHQKPSTATLESAQPHKESSTILEFETVSEAFEEETSTGKGVSRAATVEPAQPDRPHKEISTIETLVLVSDQASKEETTKVDHKTRSSSTKKTKVLPGYKTSTGKEVGAALLALPDPSRKDWSDLRWRGLTVIPSRLHQALPAAVGSHEQPGLRLSIVVKSAKPDASKRLSGGPLADGSQALNQEKKTAETSFFYVLPDYKTSAARKEATAALLALPDPSRKDWNCPSRQRSEKTKAAASSSSVTVGLDHGHEAAVAQGGSSSSGKDRRRSSGVHRQHGKRRTRVFHYLLEDGRGHTEQEVDRFWWENPWSLFCPSSETKIALICSRSSITHPNLAAAVAAGPLLAPIAAAVLVVLAFLLILFCISVLLGMRRSDYKWLLRWPWTPRYNALKECGMFKLEGYSTLH